MARFNPWKMGLKVINLSIRTYLYLIVRIGNGIITVVTLAMLTRMMSPEEYGVFALCISVVTLVSAILFQPLSSVVSRFYLKNLDDPSNVMGVAAVWFWVSTIIAAFLFLTLTPFYYVLGIKPYVPSILFLITVALGSLTLALQVANTKASLVRYGLLSWSKGIVTLFICFIFISYGTPESGALLAFLAGLLFTVICFAPKAWFSLRHGIFNRCLSAQMLRYGMPLILNVVALLIVDFADRFLIYNLLGTAFVAAYSVAYDFVQQAVGSIMNALFLTAFPLIVKVFESKKDKLVRIRLYLLGYKLIGIGLPVAVGVGVLSKDIAAIVFDEPYRLDAALIMPWLAAAIFIGTFKSYFLDVVFHLNKSTKFIGYIAALMAIVNIMLNLILLPQYGVIASSWVILVTFSVGALTSWIFGSFIFSLPSMMKISLKSISSSFVMGVVLEQMPNSNEIYWLLIKISVGIITYLLMVWALEKVNIRKLFIA